MRSLVQINRALPDSVRVTRPNLVQLNMGFKDFKITDSSSVMQFNHAINQGGQ